MLENDFMIRNIEMMTQFIASVIFKKKDTNYTVIKDENGNITQGGKLCSALHLMINDGKICEAEDMLFDAIEENPSIDNLEIAVDFYGCLNTMDDAFLSDHNFSRPEIMQGIDDIQKIYGISPVSESM